MKIYTKLAVLLWMISISPIISGSKQVDQRGLSRDSKPDIGAYEFIKTETITLSADVPDVANGKEVHFTVSITPEAADPTFFTFSQTPGGLLSFVSSTDNVFTWAARAEGATTVTVFSVDNPSVISNSVALTVVAGSGLDLIEKKPFVVYPNPASDRLYFSENINDELAIVSILGLSYVFRPNNNQVNVSSLPEGIYTVYCRSNNKILKNKLVIKH